MLILKQRQKKTREWHMQAEFLCVYFPMLQNLVKPVSLVKLPVFELDHFLREMSQARLSCSEQ